MRAHLWLGKQSEHVILNNGNISPENVLQSLNGWRAFWEWVDGWRHVASHAETSE